MPVHKDPLYTFPPQIYQRIESDREWTTLWKIRNHCEAQQWKRGLPGPQGKVGAEDCADIFEESWEEESIKKKSVLLGKDATETSTKPTLALHGLCGSGVELPDKIHDAQLNLILSKIMNSFFSMSYEISRTHLYLKNYSLYTISSNLAGNLVLFFWLNIATLVCWPRSMSACSTAPSFLLYY